MLWSVFMEEGGWSPTICIPAIAAGALAAAGPAAICKELKRPESPILDREKRYELVEHIDLAERVNPETRVASERARQAAAVVGLAESEYFPILVLHASAGGQSIPFPIPTNVVPEGFFRADNLLFNPTLALRWLLFDFGRRRATVTAATEQLLAANLGFNNKHQQIVFTVQKSFYALTSTRGESPWRGPRSSPREPCKKRLRSV